MPRVRKDSEGSMRGIVSGIGLDPAVRCRLAGVEALLSDLGVPCSHVQFKRYQNFFVD